MSDTFEFEQLTQYGKFDGRTEIWISHDTAGLTIDSMIMVNYNPKLRNQVEQNVVAVLPDSEGIKLRDYLLSVYPLSEV